MTKVVLNKTSSSLFGLSDEALNWLSENGYEDTVQDLKSSSLDRDDPGLVAVTEELGRKAGSGSCNPVIVTVPDDVEWHLSSRMQKEIIEEDYREWSA